MYLFLKILKINSRCKIIENQCLKNRTNKLRTRSSYNIWLLLWDEILLVRFQEPIDQCHLPSQLNLSITLQNFHWAIESLFNICHTVKTYLIKL